MFINKKWMVLIALVAIIAGTLPAFAQDPRVVYLPLVSVGGIETENLNMAAPSAPILLFCEGMPNPLYVINPQPEFSALFQDADTGDLGYYYQIQVDNDPAFGTPIWDSGKTAMPHVGIGARCDDVPYDKERLYGGTSPNGKLYRWNDANAWEEVAPKLTGFTIFSLAVYNDRLYGGTGNNAKLFRWNDVDAWEEVAPKPGAESYIRSLVVYNGRLYGGTGDHG